MSQILNKHVLMIAAILVVFAGLPGFDASAQVAKKPAQKAAATAAAAERASNNSDSQVTSGVRQTMKRIGDNKVNSFCYAIEDGKIQGVNADKPVRIASVMKLMTTFWAVETMGPNYRYKTKIFIQPGSKKMHISGSRDPFFDRDRLYMLISDLNKIGFQEISQLTVDKNFRIDYDATEFQYNSNFLHPENHADSSLADDNIKEKLETGFNTEKWWSSKKGRYLQVRSRNATTGMLQTLSMKTAEASVVEFNPLAGKPGVIEFQIQSAPLKIYLKHMNILSINPVADELFHSMGGESGFRRFLTERYKMGDAAADAHTGSGLPLHGPRDDSSISCSNVVRMIRRMDLDLEQKYKMDLADVMMVSGVDTPKGATFSDNSRSLIVKTGTLTAPGSRAKNLAGVESTSAGEVYFGIFLQDRSASSGNVRSILSSMMRNFKSKQIQRSGVGHFDSIDTEMQLIKTSPSRKVAIRRS